MIEFTKKYYLYFQRMDDKFFTNKEELLDFLRGASIALIVSSQPDIDNWVAEDQVNGTWKMSYN